MRAAKDLFRGGAQHNEPQQQEARPNRAERRRQERELKKKMQRANKDPYTTVLADNFLGVNWWEKSKIFPNFVIYYNPQDFPGKYVVRLFDGNIPRRIACVKDTLEEARATIPMDCPVPYMRNERSPEDDPVIVEVWL